MRQIVVIVLSLLAITACSHPKKGSWIPVQGIVVLSQQDGQSILTSADLPRAEIVAELKDGRRKRTIWFQLTEDAVNRYMPRQAQHLVITLRGDKIATVEGYEKIGTFANNYLFDVPDTILQNGKRLSDVLLTWHEDGREPFSPPTNHQDLRQ